MASSCSECINGETKQSGNTRGMAFDVAALVAHASSFMTLEPGDVLLTGTPEGVGPLTAGDSVQIEIAAVGSLEFSVMREME